MSCALPQQNTYCVARWMRIYQLFIAFSMSRGAKKYVSFEASKDSYFAFQVVVYWIKDKIVELLTTWQYGFWKVQGGVQRRCLY